MKKTAILLMVALLATFYSCKKDDDNTNNVNNDTTQTITNDTVSQADRESFYGDWDMTAEILDAHLTASLMGMYNIDSTISLSDLPMSLSIQPTSGNQVSVTGYITLMEDNSMDISTTGTIDNNGLSIEDVPFNGAFDMPVPGELIDSMPTIMMFLNSDTTVTINYSGTLSFSNPQPFPENDILNVTGAYYMSGEDAGVMGMHLITLNIDAPLFQSFGTISNSSNRRK